MRFLLTVEHFVIDIVSGYQGNEYDLFNTPNVYT